ncbi:hypothetical protein EO98_06550 [Methanosarcina sp. 2.H.T.1A.6]|nr:hypothetical protein EO94_19015 [Methanosarcina sp. 2.H.T.1A.3]KKG19542.1 hypothetical protein EO97_02810 [Methanosarcina sp. 2.H.T.1A.15]KKG21728.1 hypothetical protein EO98_06550 [Methanosarcina sp. 2.H.T.1A.6]KKG23723.1 hypothetical protein EO96_02800 [Methanosarcina sp. 2.H.T.1A.8]
MKTSLLTRFVLLSTSFTFLMITISLIYLEINPVMGYEISIYSSTPSIFWISMILGLINGFLLTYLGITDQIKRAHILGIFEILFVNSLVLLLSALRDYIVNLLRGDAPSYIGLVKDLTIHGNLTDDFYPFVSIMVSQLHQISNISIVSLAKYIPTLFYIFSILSIYCLSKSLICDKKFIFFSVIAATPLFFAWFSTAMYYMLLSVFTLPLLFYLLTKLEDMRFRLLIIIFCFVFPLFHPITAIVVILYLFLSYLVQRYPFSDTKNYYIPATLVILSSVSLIFWFSNQYAVTRSFFIIVANLLGIFQANSTFTQATYYSEKLGFISTIYTLSHLILDEMIFYSLAVVAIYLIIFKKGSLEKRIFAPFIACFITGTLLVMFLFCFTVAHRPDRLLNLNFNMMLAPLFVAYLLYLNHKNRLKTVLLISLILLATVSTYFSLYQSPFTTRPNDYMTLSEYHGSNWLLCNKNFLIHTVDLANPISRYADFTYGVTYRALRKDLKREYLLPDHFGFATPFDNRFPIDRDRYLVLSPYDEEAYTNIWGHTKRFNKDDFGKIDECQNTLKIFDDGGFKTYLIRV